MKKRTLLLAALLTLGTGSLTFAQSTNPAPYCDASFDDAGGFNVPDQINSVVFGDLANTTDTQAPGNHYIYFDNLSLTDFTKDSTYPLTIILDVHGGAGYGVWIDFNGDHDFSSDELVSGTDSANFADLGIDTITTTVQIPATAVTGKTRMRVRIVEDDNYTAQHGAAILPCNADTTADGIMDWGETEDYDINIVEAADTTPPSAINEITAKHNFVLYPNPVQSTLKIKTALSGVSTYKIVNLTGRVVLSGTVKGENATINVSTLTDGMYFMQLFDKNGVIGHERFVKTTR